MFSLIPFDRRENSMLSYFDRMEKEMFGDMFGNMDSMVSAIRTDIKEENDKYVLEAELPGFTKEEIHLDLDDDRLTISAQHSAETEDKHNGYLRRERKYGSFQRSFDVTGIDTANITAEYKDGILALSMPKALPKAVTTRSIELK
ncbi:MAG: Hsp20/alpha crystallin family protein [Oscillospiraceae bacterium]